MFFDPGTSGNCRIVTVAAKTSSEHPDTVEAFASVKVESATGSHAVTQNKWMIDSDQALAAVRNISKLKGLTGAEYRLSQARSGQEALWIVSLFNGKPEPVGRFQVGARTGTVKILMDE